MAESLSVAAVYAATLAVVGWCTADWLGVRSVGKAALGSAVALWGLLLARLLTHSVAVFDVPAGFTRESLSIIAGESRWGSAWRMQMGGASACVAGAWWRARSSSRAARIAMSLAAVFFTFTLPLLGHSSGSSLRIAVAGGHVLAAGAWLGTLAALLAHGLPGADAGSGRAARAALFHRFSPVAASAATTAAATGALMAWFYLGPPRAVLETGYGRLLAAKLALFGGVSVCGYLNWRRARIGAPLAAPAWEVALAAAIVVVTGFLTEAAHP